MNTQLITTLLPMILFFAACKSKEEQCPDCGQHGACIGVTCNCDPFYTGEKCDQEITPAIVLVSGLTLVNYPPTNGLNNWDDFSQWADPYVVISTGSTILYQSQRFDEVSPATGCTWIVDRDFPATLPITITLYDFDSNGTDSVIFSTQTELYQPGKGFPTTINFTSNNTQIQILVAYK